MAEFRTHYDNLQIARNASEAVIRAAYRILSQKHHPDKNPENAETAHARIKIINRAYEVLSDPRQRAEYDAWVNQQEFEISRDEAQAKAKEHLLKQQELARRVRLEEQRREQAEDELARVRTELLKERTLARRRLPPLELKESPERQEPHQVQALLAAPAARNASEPRRSPALSAAWNQRRGLAIFMTAAIALAVYAGADRWHGDDRPSAEATDLQMPKPAEPKASVALRDSPAAMSIERHASRKRAENAVVAAGGTLWDGGSTASLEQNQMWGPSQPGNSNNFFIKIRNETGRPANGIVFELSDQPCDKASGAKILYYVFSFPKPLESRQSASYPGKST